MSLKDKIRVYFGLFEQSSAPLVINPFCTEVTLVYPLPL